MKYFSFYLIIYVITFPVSRIKINRKKQYQLIHEGGIESVKLGPTVCFEALNLVNISEIYNGVKSRRAIKAIIRIPCNPAHNEEMCSLHLLFFKSPNK